MAGPMVDPADLQEPHRELPAGAELPDERIVTFRPSSRCPCDVCELAFRALAAGTLRWPEGDLPW